MAAAPSAAGVHNLSRLCRAVLPLQQPLGTLTSSLILVDDYTAVRRMPPNDESRPVAPAPSTEDEVLSHWFALCRMGEAEMRHRLRGMARATTTQDTTVTDIEAHAALGAHLLRLGMLLQQCHEVLAPFAPPPPSLSPPPERPHPMGGWPAGDATSFEDHKRTLDATLHPVVCWCAWVIHCIFPPFSHPSVNYCRLRGPRAFLRSIWDAPLSHGETKPSSWWQCTITFTGIFAAIAAVGALHQYYTLSEEHWPMYFGSYGTLSTLIFVTPLTSPTQPFHIFLGTPISAALAVLIEQSMNTSSSAQLWLAGALSTAGSITAMQLLGCTFPPGGALAFLYISTPSLHVLGYWYIVAALAGTIIIFLVALLINNLPDLQNRHYPGSWIG